MDRKQKLPPVATGPIPSARLTRDDELIYPPPPLKLHPPGRRLVYCGQEQPIAARAARWRTMENAIVIVVAITQGQAEARVWLQEVVEPQGLRPLLSLLSKWKSVDGSKTCFAHPFLANQH
jgi:hypothetical protein